MEAAVTHQLEIRVDEVDQTDSTPPEETMVIDQLEDSTHEVDLAHSTLRAWESDFVFVPSKEVNQSHLKTFHLFSKLPLEIQRLIWRESVQMATNTVEFYHDVEKKRFVPISAIPTHLHICRESRFAALEHYQLALGTGKFPPRSYINFDTDWLVLHDCDYENRFEALSRFLDAVAKEEREAIRSLAVDTKIAYTEQQWRWRNVRRLPALKRIAHVSITMLPHDLLNQPVGSQCEAPSYVTGSVLRLDEEEEETAIDVFIDHGWFNIKRLNESWVPPVLWVGELGRTVRRRLY